MTIMDITRNNKYKNRHSNKEVIVTDIEISSDGVLFTYKYINDDVEYGLPLTTFIDYFTPMKEKSKQAKKASSASNVITHNYEKLPYTYNSIVTSSDGEVIQKQLIKGTGQSYKVIYNDDVTIVILSDGSKGIARKNPKDKYNRQVAHDIAHARASIKSLEGRIRELTKSGYAEERRVEFGK